MNVSKQSLRNRTRHFSGCALGIEDRFPRLPCEPFNHHCAVSIESYLHVLRAGTAQPEVLNVLSGAFGCCSLLGGQGINQVDLSTAEIKEWSGAGGARALRGHGYYLFGLCSSGGEAFPLRGNACCS